MKAVVGISGGAERSCRRVLEIATVEEMQIMRICEEHVDRLKLSVCIY